MNGLDRDSVLYHYCSTDTFLSVVKNKQLWLSDLNTMNDYSETHWAYDRFVEAANNVIDEVGEEVVDALDRIIAETQSQILSVIGCFSTDGDVLSQWRSYADEGRGLAIGFDAKLMERLSVRFVKIEYQHAKQVAHFETLIRAYSSVIADLDELEREKATFEIGSRAGIDLAIFKNPAFNEEKEVRIIRALNICMGKDGQMSFSDNGGSGDEKTSRKKLQVEYRASQGGIVTFIKMPIGGLGKNFIREVVVGPRSPNSGNEVSAALKSNGYTGFRIRHSSATFR